MLNEKVSTLINEQINKEFYSAYLYLEFANYYYDQGLAHEEYVTSLINKIYKAAKDVDDFRTMQCFDWFVKEQGEEEKTADDLLKKFKLFGNDPKGLYALNQELLARGYTAPSLVL